VPPQDYVKLVLDPVVKLYQSPDRGTRMALLEGLGEYEGKMDSKCVQERVWPHLVSWASIFGEGGAREGRRERGAETRRELILTALRRIVFRSLGSPIQFQSFEKPP